MRRESTGGWRALLTRLLLPAVALLQLGGDCGTPITTGALGNANFSFVDESGNQIPMTPVASDGTTVEIEAWVTSRGCSPVPQFTRVGSSRPEVATFSYDGTKITGTTAATGTTDLELYSADGALVDRLSIEVEAIAALQFSNVVDLPQVVSRGAFQVKVDLLDAHQRPLAGPGRVKVTASAPLSATASDCFLGTAAVINGTSARPGPGTLTALAGTVQASIAIQAVAPGDITSIDLGTGPWAPHSYSNGQLEVVWTTPLTAQGPVYGADCAWTISDPSVTLSATRPAIDLGETAHNHAEFSLTSPGTFDATCTIGGARTTITLKR